MAKLTEQVIVCTGAGQGIGKTVAEVLAKEGASVAVVDVNAEAARNVSDAICAAGDNAIAVATDVCDEASIKNMIAKTVESFGKINGLYNGAGIAGPTADIHEQTVEVWNQIIAVNLTGAFHGCRAALRQMSARGTGCIINMSSQSGKQGNSQYAAYCASKFGIIGLTQSLAIEFAPQGIRVNALCPGVVMTPLWDEMLGAYAKKRNLEENDVIPYMESKVPLGRLATVSDVSAAAVFLASADASYFTGQSINVSGGVIMD